MQRAPSRGAVVDRRIRNLIVFIGVVLTIGWIGHGADLLIESAPL
jgi:hypothetical protein